VNRHYALVAEQAAHRCESCRAPEAVFNFPFEVEHIIPPLQGGVDAATNFALACRACNVRKASYLDGPDDKTKITVRLYHPREDHWEEHFQVNTTTGALVGRTPIGRATIARLQMNAPVQLAARQQWMLLGVFP
jgi:hypothetical protein